MTTASLSSLAVYAANPQQTQGRKYSEPVPNYRNEYQRDRDRIIHSAAFRRLEYKTQVFVNHEGDLFRTRLTHSLEVAQIARSIARTMHLHEDLSEAISLAHDLGHTPFGHAGQDALNECMREFDGFEHNLQSLRVVDVLEEKYAEFDGLNLTFETREGILKHCSRANAEKLGDVGYRFLHKKQPGLEAQLANLADEIAYNNHDVDDGLRAQLISVEQLLAIEIFRNEFEVVNKAYPKLSHRRQVHEIIRRMINRQVSDLIENSQGNIKSLQPQNIADIREHSSALISFSGDMQKLHTELKQFLRKELYKHHKVHRMTAKAHKIIKEIFQAYYMDPLLLPKDYLDRIAFLADKEKDTTKDAIKARVIADYIAGMTDRYAIAEHQRLFNPEISI